MARPSEEVAGRCTGQVVSVDAQAKILTVKPGERVTVSYVGSGSTLTAEKVVRVVPAAATASEKK